MNLGLPCHSACPVLLLGLGSVIYLIADPLIDRNIITTYSTNSVWSTSICLVFPTFIGSPLQCSQISDHYSYLTTPLRTRQICHSDNSFANPSLHRAFMLNLGPPCPLQVSAPISISLLWLGKTAKSLFIFLFFFFSFLLIGLTTTRWSTGKSHVTLSQMSQ